MVRTEWAFSATYVTGSHAFKRMPVDGSDPGVGVRLQRRPAGQLHSAGAQLDDLLCRANWSPTDHDDGPLRTGSVDLENADPQPRRRFDSSRGSAAQTARAARLSPVSFAALGDSPNWKDHAEARCGLGSVWQLEDRLKDRSADISRAVSPRRRRGAPGAQS